MTDPAAPKREQTPSNSLAIEAVRRNPIVKIVLVVLPAVISSLAAYTGAAREGSDSAQAVEGKAANVYRRTRDSVADLQDRVVELTDRIAALERAMRTRPPRAPKTTAAPVTPPAAPAAPVPAPLPATFDQAAAQAPPPPAPEAAKP